MRAVSDKAPIEITNCHVHLFTGRHVPVNYPHWVLRPVKRFPWLAIPVAWLLAFFGFQEMSEKVKRLRQFQKETQSGNQREILDNVRRHYPDNTRFVVLPMDLSQIGHKPPLIGLRAQHDELAQLAADPEVGQTILPFAKIDPRADPEATELWRVINELRFRGIKIYPRLGYPPDHKVLMQHVYPEAERRGIPIMTHCSRGGVQGRGVRNFHADQFTDPAACIPVMRAFPKLRICLAHFGGQRDWAAYVNPERPSPYAEEHSRNWQVMIRRMITGETYPELWTDISYTLFNFEEYIPFLRLLLLREDREGDILRSRVLFGSDYYMTRQEVLSEKAVCFRLRNELGEEVFRQIAETNPQIWLGERPDPRQS